MLEFDSMSEKEKLIKMTLDARREQAEKDIAEIWEEMKKAAAAGRYEVILRGKVLTKEIVDALKEQGFEVKGSCGDIDD